MALLTRKEILAADDILTKVIPVPAWGGEVMIKAWSVAEADRYGKLILTHQKDESFIEQMREVACSMSIVNEKGEHEFSADDLVALGKKSPAALNLVYEEIMKLNKLANGVVEEGPSPND